MSTITRSLLTVLLLSGIAFSLFGFLAAFEPMEASKALAWRVGYTSAAAASVALLLILRTHRKPPE